MVKIDMKIFTIIKEVSKRVPNKNFTDINGHPLWWHLLSELNGLDVTVNTDSPKFIKQLQNSNLKFEYAKDNFESLVKKIVK